MYYREKHCDQKSDRDKHCDQKSDRESDQDSDRKSDHESDHDNDNESEVIHYCTYQYPLYQNITSRQFFIHQDNQKEYF